MAEAVEEEEDDVVALVPENERVPELEALVDYFMMVTPEAKVNKVLHKRAKPPKFRNPFEQDKWEREEIRRCREGHQGMCGKMYGWFNYASIRNISGGKIMPQFRVADDMWFEELERATLVRNMGLVCVKRRRAGFSWKAAWDALHDVLFNPHFHVGMNSKSERDSIKLFEKVMFIYDNLPGFLRARIGKKNELYLFFGIKTKDEYGNTIWKGTNSEITVVPPTDSAYEGMQLGKWICDEAGKIKNLPQIWSYTEDCLLEETKRVGVPVLFGTSGDIGKDGLGLKEMWDNAEVYRLKRFFFGGWMGIYCDKYGNDQKKEAIRWIIYERKRREKLNPKSYMDFVQKYPLTPEEAFSQAGTNGIGDIALINKQMSANAENPPIQKRGYFRMPTEKEQLKGDARPIFIPDEVNGQCIIYEEPSGAKGTYVAGCDPADHDDVKDGASDMSLFIGQRMHGSERPRPVFQYTGRPKKAADYYDQAIMALLYYDAQVLIERNRYRMISFFDEHGYKHLLRMTPTGVTRIVGGRTTTIGVFMDEKTTKYMLALIEEYIEEDYMYIPCNALLQECVDYGTRNTDRVYAFGLMLMLMKEDKRRISQEGQKNVALPRFTYKRVNGKIQRM